MGEARVPSSSLSPVRKAEWTSDHARHLLWRAGFGGPQRQIDYLLAQGPEGAVEALLDFEKVTGFDAPKAEDFRSDIMAPPSQEQRREVAHARRAQDEDTLARFRQMRQEREQEDRRQMYAMQRWWLRRMIETPRPLEEKLTLFWHGHFATSYRTIENSYHMYLQNQLLRSQAAGNFGELLRAIIRDPAMIAYLDNNDSRKGRPNENLARELMELFALGEGNYTEGDIKDGARALTGYTFDFNEFVFRPEWHDEGSKRILGRTGNLGGDEFVDAILAQRVCAEFIALKLYRFFVADVPERGSPAFPVVVSVVKSLAQTLAASNYEIRPVLRRLFLSEHFHDPAVRLARVKSPAELVVGAVRTFGAPVRDLGILNDAMGLMGQELMFPPSVKGWDGGRAWINTSTVFVRANILNFILTGKTPSGYDPLSERHGFDVTSILADASEATQGAERDPEALARWLIRLSIGTDAPADKTAAVTEYARSLGDVDAEHVAKVLALITAMPEYQLC